MTADQATEPATRQRAWWARIDGLPPSIERSAREELEAGDPRSSWLWRDARWGRFTIAVITLWALLALAGVPALVFGPVMAALGAIASRASLFWRDVRPPS